MSAQYAIKKQLPIRKTLEKNSFEKKMLQASKMYERQFMQEMVKAMRSTIKHSELTKPSMAEQIYKDKMYEKYLDHWSDSGGVGLANVIYDQINSRYSPFKDRIQQRPRAPVQINKDGNPLPIQLKSQPSPISDKMSFKIDLLNNKDTSLVAPWQGKIVSNNLLEIGQVIQIEHPNKLTSHLLISNPEKLAMEKGSLVQSGQTLVPKLKESNSILWSLTRSES